MINQVIVLLNKVTPIVQKEGPKILKSVIGHFAKHKDKYIAAGGGILLGGAGAGELMYEKGKRKGRNEQSQIDKKKMESMHRDHEKDREEWNRQKKNYDDFINDIEQSL